ncbi:MAG: tyrosinase family protein [Bacteroidota bacterium]|nr:tyrosinase family protein [Bacteroidota bacterium]MDP4231142.1 tyrosinase family protein [Bacteroidota bacterium]MDP4235549.1 tyrosinase family protein [Bacteroidota bacterium]
MKQYFVSLRAIAFVAILISGSLLQSCSKPHIRKSITALTPAEITTLRTGVAAMKAKPFSDKTSWDYQAWIHGTAAGGFNQCQHGTIFFLSWHRMFLYYFERILRKASGDPNFALPYWNYSDPAQRNLPDAFRNPANATNPLWIGNYPGADPGRTPGVNSGAYSLPASAVATSGFMPDATFYTMQGDLENTPHDDVHISLSATMGGGGSAQDPIFWLHHCNIDRYWTCWLSQGGGRAFPTDATWLDQVYTFYDEDGNAVTMTGRQMVLLDPINYKYDDEPCTALKPIQIANLQQFAKMVLIDTLRLGLRRATMKLALPAELRSQMDILSSGKAENAEGLMLELNFSNFHLPKIPEIFYEVYVNLPANADLEKIQFNDPHYIGNLSFFGFPSDDKPMHHHEGNPRTITLRMTDNLKTLVSRNEFNSSEVHLTFVPRALVDQNGADVLPKESPEISIGNVSVAVTRLKK